VPTDDDTNWRMKELIAGIDIEQDPKRFSALVEEVNRLLDREQKPPKPTA